MTESIQDTFVPSVTYDPQHNPVAQITEPQLDVILHKLDSFTRNIELLQIELKSTQLERDTALEQLQTLQSNSGEINNNNINNVEYQALKATHNSTLQQLSGLQYKFLLAQQQLQQSTEQLAELQHSYTTLSNQHIKLKPTMNNIIDDYTNIPQSGISLANILIIVFLLFCLSIVFNNIFHLQQHKQYTDRVIFDRVYNTALT